MPIGITKATVATPIKGWPAGDYVGMTCAACHNGQLRYKGKLIRIEGGFNNAIDLQGLARGLDDALRTILTDGAKFDRLARRLGASSPDAKDKLRKRVEGESDRVHYYATREIISRYPFGPGRIDALAIVENLSAGRVCQHHALALAVAAQWMSHDGAARHVVVLDQSQAPLAVTARTGDQAAAQQQEPLRRFGESP